jgi:HEPN domain-containing protein
MGAPDLQVANQLTQEARARFEHARQALGQGDRVRAAEEARKARRFLVRAMVMGNGSRGVMALVERAEELAAEVALSPEGCAAAAALQGELNTFNERARILLHQYDSLAAASLGVLAQMRYQHRCREEGDAAARLERATLAVGFADAAVSLAARLLESGEPVPDQLRYLEAATEYLAAAVTALQAGENARAIYLAQHAQWAALKAVALPGDVTVEQARALSELARTLYAEAEAAVGTDPSELQALLLDQAQRLIEAGEAKLADGYHRGIGALWRAAVICTWLIG